MKLGILHISIIFSMSTLFLPELQAQLSPGALTHSHAELEGISNCTKCHTLGEKVSNEKCLACHDEIEVRINRGEGYHASREVRGQDCAECHSEHHGRKFDMVRFDENSFSHNLTGYELTGAHQRIDCRDCHRPDYIEEDELKRRTDTYLGLPQACASCHDDYHQGTLSTSRCAECHTTDAFAPAPKFDHSETAFALRGQHQQIDCKECHQQEIRNGQEFQVFTGLDFTNCNSCHDDAHRGNLGSNCKQCHHEQSFASTSQLRQFNHSRTNFPLKGSHNRIECADCHNMDVSATTIFQDRLGIPTNDCNRCHEDVHDDQFGNNCADCHNESAFQDVNMDHFNHDLTSFHLSGKHQSVDCRECHTESFIEPVPHNECAACHQDYHEGAFTTSSQGRDCAECHTEDGFEITLYTLEEHNRSDFPLEGAHLATPCFACHLQEDKWAFRNIGERCVDCHEDVHEGYIAEEYYPEQDCRSCHVTESWQQNHFNHSLTDFELQGAHTRQECMDCHSVEDESRENRYAGFTNLSSECVQCHENVHDRQFEREGITNCARCHGFENWGINDFNHDQTNFKLEGRHAEIACEACHQPVNIDGEVFVQYKFESFECVDCHK